MRMPLFRILLVASALACPQAVRAQSPNTGALVVAVMDQSGATVAGARVSVTNTQTGAVHAVDSSSTGSATLAALPLTGSYRVRVERPGFVPGMIDNVVLRAGETAVVRVTLTAGGGQTEVTVYGTAEGVRYSPQLGMRLDSEDMTKIPILGRKITSVPLVNASFRSAKGTGDLFVNATYFVTGAGGRRQPAVTVDGATNDEPWGRQTMFATIPMGAVQEMDVLSHAFSAEFGWTASAAVNIVTRAGTNDVHGDLLVLGRPGAWQATTLPGGLLPPDIPDALAQGSFAFGAPLVKDQTFVFAAGDYTHQNRSAPITSPLAPDGTTIVGKYRQALMDVRIDHRLSAAHAAMFRANLDRFYDTNPQDAVSGTVLPGAGREFTRHTFSVQGNDTATLGPNLLNEARIEYLNGDPITQFEPISPSTRFTRSGAAPFTSGESRFAHIFSRQVQISDTLTWTRGRHALRIGGSAAYSRSGGDGTEFGSAFVLGQFTVDPSTTTPLAELTLADMTRYTQSFNLGKSEYVQSQWLLAAFVQDHFRARDNLTLDLGLRYDRQTFTDATANVAPRVGFAWDLTGDARTSVRGGYGMYYTALRSNYAAGFELGGPEGLFTYSATPGQTGFPATLTGTPVVFDAQAASLTLPARNITIRPGRRVDYTRLLGPVFALIPDCPAGPPTTDGRPCYDDALVNPRSQVTSIGIERQLRKHLFVEADYVHQHWTGIERTVDLNAPSYFERTTPGQVRSAAAADATRPIVPVNGGFRVINALQNVGVADYDGLQTMVSYRGDARLSASLSYTLSKSTNTTEPDGNGVGANDANRLGEAERGPSVLDQRHRMVLSASYRLPFGLTAGTMTSLASARPYNSTTGVDSNGDGAQDDRAVIDGQVAGKSAFRGSGLQDVSLFVEERIRAPHGSLRLRLEAFNVFNHANVLGRQSVYGNGAVPNANFGEPNAGLSNIDPPRMVQVAVQYSF
jgi:hypothetical protein